MTTPEDVDTIVGYLKNKPVGATLAEIQAALDPKYVDGRKVSAYVQWGFVQREGDRLKLTPMGRELSRASEARRKSLFSSVIRNVKAYRVATEWIFHQGFEVVSQMDLAAHWYEHCRDEVGTDNERTIGNHVWRSLG